MTQRHPRVENKAHLKWVSTLPCLICLAPDHSDPHHIKPGCSRFGKRYSGTLKPDDCFVVPLCRVCHNKLHEWGSETEFWNTRRGGMSFIIVLAIAMALWIASGDYERGCQIVRE